MLADLRLVAEAYVLHFASGMIDRETGQIVAAAVVASPASDDVSSVFEIALRER
ncbi:hypothetical protein [Sorangium sp. So ce1000]|uniref:hypothetical protein n=1 Tax=Sorangium sp. So ce1000 TaxID=3133325 RepID=UPI003F6428BF